MGADFTAELYVDLIIDESINEKSLLCIVSPYTLKRVLPVR